VLLALALRLALALATIDVPGDGPSRAALGRQWLEAPRLLRDGHWLPLGEVLVGLANLVSPDPLWAARALSLATGSLSVAVLASLAGALIGPAAGLAAAALLALLPMHVALSATALVDAPALLFLLLAVRLALVVAEASRPALAMAGLAAAAALATGLRYEAWLLVPLLPLHQLLATGRPGRAALVLLAVLPLPAWWTLAALGGLAGLRDGLGYVTASGASVGGAAVAWPAALAVAGGRLLAALGPLTAALAVAGLWALPWRSGRARRAGLTLLLLLLLACLALLLVLAAGRGVSLVDRYALTAATLALPLAAAGAVGWIVAPKARIALVLLLAGGTAATTWWRPPELYLRRGLPAEVHRLAAWLDRERPPGTALLFTRAGWWPTHVVLLHPLGREEYRIVSWYLEDVALRAFLRRARPALLVTRPGDEALVERVRAAGAEAGLPLARFGALEVRPLRLSTPAAAD
jgi:4-amino-4-deoxy-L-arabinose transferase-like glycosyltransferase